MSAVMGTPIQQHAVAGSSSYSQATPRPTRSRGSATASPGSPGSSSPRGGSSGVIDVEAVLRAAAGDVHKALEVMITERNSLVGLHSRRSS